MTASFRSKSHPQDKPIAYENFMGLDTSRSDSTQDTGSNQVLRTLSGGYCDEHGQIVRDPGYYRLTKNDGAPINDWIAHATFFTLGEVAWAYRVKVGLGFDSVRDHRTDPVWPANAIPSSTTFNGITVVCGKALTPYTYNGYIWREADLETQLSEYKPAFITTVQNRAVIAGIPLKSTELHLSQTNQLRFYDETRDANDESVTRPGYIDIQNLITRSESITGIAPFEQSRLAIFTQDRMILYNTHPDLELWTIDETANVNIGCISHNTIQVAGTDLIFCSRTGVHSVRRSRENGILVSSSSMSDRVRRLYLSLVKSVENPQSISAVFDQDEGKYHIFFPQAGTPFTKRLTLSFNPYSDRHTPKWSLTQFLNETCGDSLGGQTIFGTRQGLFLAASEEDRGADEYAPLTFSFPTFWHRDIVNKKKTASILIQAQGHGTINIVGRNDSGAIIFSDRVTVEYNEDDLSIPSVPLSAQYERPFNCEYRGINLSLEVVDGKGLFVLSGIAIYIRGV